MTAVQDKYIVNLQEYETLEVEPRFTAEELRIIQTDLEDKLQLTLAFDGRHLLKAQQYVGYVVLPSHVINIRPKIHPLTFINMVRYALSLPEPKLEEIMTEQNQNFYDILVSLLIHTTNDLIKKGLYSSYMDYEDNLNCVRGKILFKEHIFGNFDRKDKVYCRFSELTPDVIENRIIKFTLFHLIHNGHFLDSSIHSRLIECYKRLDQVELVPLSLQSVFARLSYTPLNEHYRPTLALCELLLLDSSIHEERIGDKTSISFLIDMNRLFEKFIGNLLRERFGSENILLQSGEHPEKNGTRLGVILDVMVLQNHLPKLVLDTKYKKFESIPAEEDVAQLALYSLATGVRKCALVYPGKSQNDEFVLKGDIHLHVMFIDLAGSDRNQFKELCNQFILKLTSIL